MAPPSPSSPFNYKYKYKYDVFLSFYGPDTRHGFTGNLYTALCQRGFSTFLMDKHDLRTGEDITAIRESRMAIIIFSKNYASSAFCLDQLAQIIYCALENNKGMRIRPIFYDVGPLEVRHQTGTYGEALAMHEQGRFKDDVQKVKKWRKALRKAADLPRWYFIKQWRKMEHELIREIADKVTSDLTKLFLPVADYPVGIEARMRHVLSLLDTGSDIKVQMLGICGMGGIGKTTIARAIYNLMVNQFEGSCFLENISEKSAKHGLVQIQETMLSQLVGERNIKLGVVKLGISLLSRRLRRQKVLVIIDDVDKMEQLEATAGILDWFGFGSIIIITTRDEQLLVSHGVTKLYKVHELNNTEALELFRQKAFKNQEVDPRYTEMVECAIHYAGGLPLALEVIGSNLFGRTVDEWKSALEAYERIPNKDMQETLRVSYDGLEENEKEIFLDIACLFPGCSVKYFTSILHGHGFQPKYGIRVLEEKSLIKIGFDGVVTMHDLIQCMGKEIVRQQSTFWLEKRNRLWFHEDIIHVLENNTGNNKIEAIMLDMHEDKDFLWNQGVFGKMEDLKMLIIKNGHNFTSPKHLPNSLRVLEWRGYPSASLPFGFLPKNLIVLNLSHSKFEWGKPLEKSESLSHLIFTGCDYIRQMPDVSSSPNLTELCVDDCPNLITIHDSVGCLDKLQRFSAKGCTMLRTFPREVKLPSLEYLCLRDCSNLGILPEILGPMEKLQFIDFEGTAIKNLPHSMQNLKGLQSLSLSRCAMLSIDVLSNIFPFLKKLRLDGTNLTIIPKSIEECRSLKVLSVKDCKPLNEIRGLPQNITSMNTINCPSLNIHAAPTNMVLKQIFQNGSTIKRSFRLTGEKLPEWFDLCNRGNFVSFWFRNGIPDITMGVVTRGGNREYNCYFKINNDFKINFSNFFSYSCLGQGEIFIFNDLRGLVSSCPTLAFLDKWNYAEISFEQSSTSYHLGKEPVRWSGVYVNRESMEDIQFTNPYPAVCDHQEMAPGESSQAQGQADVEMEASYAYPDGGARVPSHSHDKSATTSLSEDAREALKIVQDFIDYDASILFHPEQCTVMKTNLDYLSTLSEDDGISEEMMTLISEASREFTHWCMDYTEATEKIESTASDLSRADKLEADLEDNKKRFRQIVALESDLLKKLAEMEERKKKLKEQIIAIIADIPSNQLEKKNELEEQIKDIIADISSYQLEKKMVHRRKRGTFEEGKMLKTQRDELRKKKPDLQHEHGLAKETHTKITDEWSKLGEKFKKIFAMAQGESSQAHGFAVVQNFQAQSPALSSGEVNGESSLNQVESDEEMEAFYASLEVEKTREALKIVQDFMSNDSSILLHPEQCTVLKTNLDFLSNNLTEDDVISREVITLISEASREFSHWSKDYTEASIKVASISCELLRAEELEAALKDNMKQYKDAVAKENVHQRKRDIFEKGKMLKTRRDDLREKIPHLQHEHCLAKETQTRIEDEWSKLRENLKKIFID